MAASETSVINGFIYTVEQTVQLKLQAALEDLVTKQPEDPINYLAD